MRPLLFLLSLCLLAACKKKEPGDIPTPYTSCPTKCVTLSYRLIFSNDYLAEDLDTVIVRQYRDSFTTLVLDTTYTLADTVHYRKTGVFTDYIGTGYKGLWAEVGHEYEIEIPATSQLFRIWNIIGSERVMLFDCDMPVKSCFDAPDSISVSGGDHVKEQYDIAPIYLRLKK